MHAVVVTVSIAEDAGEGVTKHLRENIVPMVSQAPGFVAGYSVHNLEGGDRAGR